VWLAILPMNLAGLAGLLKLFLDFDAGAVDQVINRLTVLHTQMLMFQPHGRQRNAEV